MSIESIADEALIGYDALLSELVRQRGEMKLCYDEQDGWFVQFCYMHQRDAWMTLDRDEERHASPTAAIKAARLAHNDEVERQRKSDRCAIHYLIPDNDEVSHRDRERQPDADQPSEQP